MRGLAASRQDQVEADGCAPQGVLAENEYSQIDQIDWSIEDARLVLEILDCAPERQRKRQLKKAETSERGKQPNKLSTQSWAKRGSISQQSN